MEDIFAASRLEVLIPETRTDITKIDTTHPDWYRVQLASLQQRKLAFFDERLYIILTVRLPKDSSNAFAGALERFQVSLEASYISPSNPSVQSSKSPLPPLSHIRPRSTAPVIPPGTPHPIPTTDMPDKQHAQADPGVILLNYIWGEERPVKFTSTGSAIPSQHDRFKIAWSPEDDAWIAIYELNVLVTFLPARALDPLLCLTVSTTLRDRSILSSLASKLVNDALSANDISTDISYGEVDDRGDDTTDIMQGMEEVNLLGGLNEGSTFNSPAKRLLLPSDRAPQSLRKDAFYLPPSTTPGLHASKSVTTPAISRPTLRKSYRKTLKTAEAVKVRMRNCFVPYVPTAAEQQDEPDVAAEERVAGSEERTVILSIEIENSAEPGLGFIVEDVKVDISGGLAHASLISWGSDGTDTNVFPMTLKGVDQYNLLYRVFFVALGDFNEQETRRGTSLTSSLAVEMQRQVTINITGHVFRPSSSAEAHFEPFTSRWNCLLDMFATQEADPPSFYDRPASPLTAQDALPAPASPFPSSKTYAAITSPFPSTPPAPWVDTRKSYVGSALGKDRASLIHQQSAKFTPSPPSAVVAAMNAKSTNANAAALAAAAASFAAGSPTPRSDRFPYTEGRTSLPVAPLTPAFPSYPANSTQLENPHPSPQVVRTYTDTAQPPTQRDGNMLVSVTVVRPNTPGGMLKHTSGERKIYPHQVFFLDIFVVNLSTEVRRCEVGFPIRKRGKDAVDKTITGGLMPLDNKIRVGPLLPGSCQSVRMQVLALAAGVHRIDTLTLTDVNTSYTANLR